MPFYRPSARVRLQLRIDEGADTTALRSNLERPSPQGASIGKGASATRDGIQASLDDNDARRRLLFRRRGSLGPADFAREKALLDKERSQLQSALVGTGTARQDKPDSVDESKGAQDERTAIFSTLPQEVKIDRKGLHDAGTCRIQLDFRDVPIDPRIVRACFVSVAIGVVDADEYQAGVILQRQQEDGSLSSLVRRDPGQEQVLTSTTRFTGFVDEWLVNYGEDGDTIELICRDVSAVLRDQRLFDADGSPVRIDLTLPIGEGVQKLVDTFPATRGIKVVVGTPFIDQEGDVIVTGPRFDPVPAAVMPRPAKPRKGKQAKSKKKEQNQTAWDMIVDVTTRMGLIPSLKGFVLYLMEPRVVFAEFRNARKMIWGRNLSELKFARKLGGVRSDTIEVRCADPTIGRTRWARYPVLGGEPKSGILGKAGSPRPATTRASNVGPNGTASENVRVLSVRAVSDQGTLERIAESTFNEIGRQEIEGMFSTCDLDSFAREDLDLLRLEAGDPIQILVANPDETGSSLSGIGGERSGNPTSNLQELQAQSVARRAEYLESLGIRRETALRLARAQEQVRLVTTFRVGGVSIDWDTENGVKIGVDFHNFIVARDAPGDVSPSPAPPSSLTEAASRARGVVS